MRESITVPEFGSLPVSLAVLSRPSRVPTVTSMVTVTELVHTDGRRLTIHGAATPHFVMMRSIIRIARLSTRHP